MFGDSEIIDVYRHHKLEQAICSINDENIDTKLRIVLDNLEVNEKKNNAMKILEARFVDPNELIEVYNKSAYCK